MASLKYYNTNTNQWEYVAQNNSQFVVQSDAPNDTSVVWIDTDDNSSDDVSPTTIPSVTVEDNGKFLCVVDGEWTAVTIPYAEEVYI